METLQITPEWVVELTAPSCELDWEGCTTTSTGAFRIHDCAFYFACENCRRGMIARLKSTFARFTQMKCRNCGLEFNEKNYVEVIPL
jgi:predicted RNA-binding Zn-ribbon protein involved in translation (DUF1610 family)